MTEDGQDHIDFSTYKFSIIFLISDAEDTISYHIIAVLSCNVALSLEVWDNSVLGQRGGILAKDSVSQGQCEWDLFV